jgi:hypothetical protein
LDRPWQRANLTPTASMGPVAPEVSRGYQLVGMKAVGGGYATVVPAPHPDPHPCRFGVPPAGSPGGGLALGSRSVRREVWSAGVLPCLAN